MDVEPEALLFLPELVDLPCEALGRVAWLHGSARGFRGELAEITRDRAVFQLVKPLSGESKFLARLRYGELPHAREEENA
jgi:hypothetical protein